VTTTLNIPPFSASMIEEVCKVLADAVTGPQIPNLIAPLKVSEPPGDERNTKWKRLFNAVAERQNRQQDGRPLIRLVTDIMAPVRFNSVEQFERCRIAVNGKLLLSGYEVHADGKVGRAVAATTVQEAQQRADDLRTELARRNVHSDVIGFCRPELLERNYFHAVLEACKSVAEKLRNLSGLGGDGAQLVDAACGLSAGGPKVAFNSLATEWEESEHKGLAMMMKGVFSTFRNPAAHAPKIKWATSRADALDMLTLASMLHRRLDTAVINQSP
jgi:uncharacterized protein (TIGR02391 family)